MLLPCHSEIILIIHAFFQAVRVEHCERVQVIAAAKRICIANCRECVFFLGVNQRPLIVGDNHKLQVSKLLFMLVPSFLSTCLLFIHTYVQECLLARTHE